MRSDATRRGFLKAAGAAAGMAGLGAGPSSTPKVAALTSVYFYLSHAYHIVGRFLDGFPVYRWPSG